MVTSRRFEDLAAQPPGPSPQPMPLHFPPLMNGLDYVSSVLDLLAGDPTPRDLKYAVLHLQAAVEVLVKVRLERHNWRLMFAPSEQEPDRSRLRAGTFQSVDGSVAIRLLKREGIAVPSRLQRQYDKLAQARNQLQHYGMPQPSLAVEGRVGQVFACLLEFLPSLHSGGQNPLEDEALNECREDIAATLRRLRSVLDAHLHQAEPQLAALAAANVGVVSCPECEREALVVKGYDRKSCMCCLRSWPEEAGEELADDYASEIGGITWHDVQQGADPPVRECFECEATAFVADVKLKGQDAKVWLCFNCGEWIESDRVDFCSWCGRPIRDSHEQGLLCPACYPEVLKSWD